MPQIPVPVSEPLSTVDLSELPVLRAIVEGTVQASSLDSIAREYILAILEQTRWMIEGAKGAAQMLDLKPSTLRYRMKKLGIDKPER